MKAYIVAALMMFVSHSAIGYGTVDLTTPDGVEYSNELGITDYNFIGTMSFKDKGYIGVAYTFLFNDIDHIMDTDLTRTYTAAILSSPEGQTLGFSITHNCEVSELRDTHIRVSGQNIQATETCVVDERGSTKEIFLITTQEGSDFVVNEFKNNYEVLVRFGYTTVPFDATGFVKSWKEYGGAAL